MGGRWGKAVRLMIRDSDFSNSEFDGTGRDAGADHTRRVSRSFSERSPKPPPPLRPASASLLPDLQACGVAEIMDSRGQGGHFRCEGEGGGGRPRRPSLGCLGILRRRLNVRNLPEPLAGMAGAVLVRPRPGCAQVVLSLGCGGGGGGGGSWEASVSLILTLLIKSAR